MSEKIFLSHLHEDRRIADVLRNALVVWGIDSKFIFQSSHPKSGPQIGSVLNEQLSQALKEVSLLVLIFTDNDRDWSYCFWECGVATNPDTVKTKFVVIQCTDDVPKIFPATVRVRVTKSQIRKFTNQFHREKGFFPDKDAFRPGIDDDGIKMNGDNLYRELKKVMPRGQSAVQYRWDCMTLKLDPECVMELENVQIKKNEVIGLIAQRAEVECRNGPVLQHFGLAQPLKQMKWADFINCWRDTSKERECSDQWVVELHEEMHGAIHNRAALPRASNLESLCIGTNRSLRPILTRVRRYANEAMEFDVFFYPVNIQQSHTRNHNKAKRRVKKKASAKN